MHDLDKNSTDERCIKVFRFSIKSKKTERDYLHNLRKFKEYLNVDSYTAIVELPDIQKRLEDYVMYLRETKHPNSINTIYAPIQSFLEMNDIVLNFKKIRRFFPAKVKTAVERGWTTEEIRKMLGVAKNLRTQAIIHFENASGGRLGLFDGLKIRHLTPVEDCYAITGYAGAKEQYITFLTPEARKVLDSYIDLRRQDGETITPESPVFREKYRIGSGKVKMASSDTLGQAVKLAQENCGLRDPSSKVGNRFTIPTNHGFRHRFNEILKTTHGINVHLAEKMFAHTSRLIPLDGVYLNPQIPILFPEYKRAIPALTIDNLQQAEAERKAVLVERSEFEQMKFENESFKKTVLESLKKLQESINPDTKSVLDSVKNQD